VGSSLALPEKMIAFRRMAANKAWFGGGEAMRKLIGAALAAALATSGYAAPALAERWVEISQSPTSSHYLDVRTIRRAGSRVRFWADLRYRTVRTTRSGLRFDRDVTLIEADCAELSYRDIQSTVRLGEQVVLTPHAPDTPRTDYASPGTNMENMINAACSLSQQ
jgi:hypothetical protein